MKEKIKKFLRKLGWVVFKAKDVPENHLFYDQNKSVEDQLSILKALKRENKTLFDHTKPLEEQKRFQKVFGEKYQAFPKGDTFHYVPDIYGKSHHKQNDFREDVFFNELAQKVIQDETTLLYYDRLYNLYQVLNNICRLHPDNELNIVEAGVYRGGGSYFLAGAAEKLSQKPISMWSFDTFEGHRPEDLPQSTEGEHEVGMFAEASFESVQQYLTGYSFLNLHKMRIQECEEILKGKQFDFVHLDMDIYEPTAFALQFFASRLKPHGVIVLDDYNFKTCPGIQKAAGEFLEKNAYFGFQFQSGQFILTKAGASHAEASLG